MTANGVHYYLTRLVLSPHETRAIDLRQLRDAQGTDFRGNKIPAGATDGSVNWIRIDNVPVMGRVVVIERHQGLASNYDCGTCPYPEGYVGLRVSRGSANPLPGGTAQFYATAQYVDCNGNYTYTDVTTNALWSSSNTSVATVSFGLVTAVAVGSAGVKATYTDWFADASGQRYHETYSGTSLANVKPTVSVSCSPLDLALGPTAPSKTTTANCSTTVSPAAGRLSSILLKIQ